MSERIDNVFVVVGVNEDGDEDIPVVTIKGKSLPLIAENETALKDISLLAQLMCDMTGVELELREYTTYAVVTTFKPKN